MRCSNPFKIFLFISLISMVISCRNKTAIPKEEIEIVEVPDTTRFMPSVSVDLEEIKKRGELVAITGYNSNSYFIYKGAPMGYEYELLQRLCESLGVKLRIVIEHNMDSIFDMLNRGEGDLVAYGMTVTKSRKKEVTFTKYLNLVRQVLVQKKPENWRSLKQHQIDKKNDQKRDRFNRRGSTC